MYTHTQTHTHCMIEHSPYISTHIHKYIYYIITVLVVTKSLFGLVSNQVQYNMESAQYLG